MGLYGIDFSRHFSGALLARSVVFFVALPGLFGADLRVDPCRCMLVIVEDSKWLVALGCAA